MPKLIIMRGLPASGKSTEAEKIAKEDENCVRLNKDLLRKMLHFDKYTGKNEAMTSAAEMCLARMFLEGNKNVIIDDTNLNPRVLEIWVRLALELKIKWEVKGLETEERYRKILNSQGDIMERHNETLDTAIGIVEKGFGES